MLEKYFPLTFYSSVLLLISLFIFLILSIYYWYSIRKIEKRTRKTYTWWKFLNVLGSFGLGASIFLFGQLIEWIYVKNINIILSFFLLPFSFAAIIFFLFFYFTIRYKDRGINCYKSSDLEKMINIYVNKFFPSAEKSIKIFSGTIHPNFYGNSRIIEALKKLKTRNVDIKIIFSYPDQEDVKKKVKDFINNSLIEFHEDLYLLPRRIPENHFAIIDRSHVKIEQRHKSYWERGLKKPESKEFESWFYFWSPFLAWGLNHRTFSVFLKMAKRYPETRN